VALVCSTASLVGFHIMSIADEDNAASHEQSRRVTKKGPLSWSSLFPSRTSPSTMLAAADARERRSFRDGVQMRLLCADLKPGLYGCNRFHWQATYVIDNLLEFALERHLPIRVFKGTSSSAYYGHDFYARLCSAANVVSPVELVFAERLSSPEQMIWQNRQTQSAGRLRVYHLAEYDETMYHHFLAGDAAYRLEFPHVRPTKETQECWAATGGQPERPARFSFNDPELGKLIGEYHRSLLADAQQV
jgi:hypothetical protein